MRRRLPDILIVGLLFALPLILFARQTIGGRTLLPAENLYQYEPYTTYREVVNAPAVPHNHLLSDLVLQNMQWKAFIRQQFSQGEIPLWNPHQLAGVPFLAAGQPSTLYPVSILYYILDLPSAYGWFTVITLWMAGAFTYAFARGIGIGRTGAAAAGVTYQLCGFLVTSAVFPMIMASAAWLPLLLLIIELIIRQQPLFGRPVTLPWAVIGAVALGCNILAGHVEITYYSLLIAGYYAAVRLVWLIWIQRRSKTSSTQNTLRFVTARMGWLLAMILLGLGIGAVQFVPLYELASTNWRAERGSIETVLSYAHPLRDLVQFILPNFYGNPSHHSYFDLLSFEQVTSLTNLRGESINFIEWGIKNYVEGALYLGILPLALAAYALVDAGLLRRKQTVPAAPYRLIFAGLVIIGLSFMFGMPTYRLLYLLPEINQLNSPFRWIFAVSFGIATLAGFGLDALEKRPTKLSRRLGWVMVALALLLAIALLLSSVFYAQLEPVLQQIVESMALADGAFSGASAFYSYQFFNVFILAGFLFGAGVVFIGHNNHFIIQLWAAHPNATILPLKARLWQIAAVVLIAADLMIASWSFNPASDPALLDFTPPAVTWLQGQPEGWRYTTLTMDADLMNANMGWRYGLDDVRGYESLITAQYVAYMRALAPQNQLDFNRVAPLYLDYPQITGTAFDYTTALNSPLFNLLNIRYVITPRWYQMPPETAEGRWTLPYEDEAVRIWENSTALPRAYIVPDSAQYQAVLPLPTDGTPDFSQLTTPTLYTPAEVLQDSGREKLIRVVISQPSWLIVSESYFIGWRAYLQDSNGVETPLTVELVQGNFQGVRLETTGTYTVRLVYSPISFQIGAFFSFITTVLLFFSMGVWLWRWFVAPPSSQSSTASRLARNSLAPILLNLFNRGIDFAFAAVMLRVLGPADAGLYQYAIVVFVWFDIFTNFGLNTFLTREVARDRNKAAHYFFNTSIMRLALIFIGILPLVGFIAARQVLVQPALDQTALLALGLLYLGLLPNSLSTGMSALFYAFEQAEYPSAVTTIATISKTVLGVLVLAFGFGIIGLAAASIVTNILTFGVLLWGGRKLFTSDASGTPQRRGQVDRGLIRQMTRLSFPLMLNHFLATIFFQIDIVLIEAIHGAEMVGQYSVAYKWLQAINVIPAFFTMALLPIMSRQAQEDRASLSRSYQLGVKLLVSIAIPTAVFLTVAAYPLTTILGGAEYLPDGAIALQLMVWSIPIGWINSLTQYVLIALDLQRRITRAFILAVGFNIITNLIFIPAYGYRAAALTTIASEAVLLLPFALLLAGAVGKVAWVDLVWRQVVAGMAMLTVYMIVALLQPLLALFAAIVTYSLVLLLLRPLSTQESQRIAPLLPGRVRRLLRMGT